MERCGVGRWAALWGDPGFEDGNSLDGAEVRLECCCCGLPGNSGMPSGEGKEVGW